MSGRPPGASGLALDARDVPSTPDELLRDVAPNQLVLLVGSPESWEAIGVDTWISAAGWSSTQAADLDRAVWLATIQKLSLVLVTGDEHTVWELVEAIRPLTMAPLVVVSTIEPRNVVALVGAGVDAVIDPVRGAEEVFARVVALLRRSDHGWAPGVRFLRAGALLIDLWARECSLDDEPISLSPTEYSLLTFLMTHPEEAVSSHTIVRRVWGWYNTDGKNALRIFVNRVRRKLGDDPRNPQFIASVRGTGYRFVRNVTQLGDDVEPLTEHADVAVLLHSVEGLAVALQQTRHIEDATAKVLDALEVSGYADGMAVFRNDDDRMTLVSARKMPETWFASVEGGVPLSPRFASAHSVLIGEPVQFGDIREMAEHFNATALELEDSGFRACLFLPVGSGDRVWGHLGLARRTPEPFDSTGSAFLRAVSALFAMRIEAIEGT
ncbi:MAG TPA: winged helix-turn-helix domain-containing protein [Acidimicrobiia bacterium]|nr:winged helix-turn-helix domain-containing protein [Acidimicrobiia bacterium]